MTSGRIIDPIQVRTASDDAEAAENALAREPPGDRDVRKPAGLRLLCVPAQP